MTDDPVAAHLDWLHQRGLSQMTIDARMHIVQRVGDYLHPVTLLDATAQDLAAWRASLTQAPGTIAGYVSHLQSFYRWAVASGVLPADPSAGLPQPKVPRRLPRPIGEDKLMYAVENAPRRVRPWLVLAAWAGLRAKEIACLRAENIRLHDDPPNLLIAADGTKGKRERVVPLSPFVVAELEAEIKAGRLPARGLAFTRLNGRPLLPCTVSRYANQHLHDCGLPDTLHSARHRFGTQTYRASHDLLAVQEMMGHTTPAVTALYAAYDKPSAQAAVAALAVPGASHDATEPSGGASGLREKVEPAPDDAPYPVLRLVGGRLWEAEPI